VAIENEMGEDLNDQSRGDIFRLLEVEGNCSGLCRISDCYHKYR